ncbi:MAG: hypothetical protein ABSE70_04660 [Candidatus Limnocylindrales bacterium]
MRAEIDRRLLEFEHVDLIEQHRHEELAAPAALGLDPRLGQFPQVADRHVGGYRRSRS